VYGAGQNVRDWIHVDDHNDAVWAIVERGAVGQTYLVGADGERSNLDVVGDLLEIFGRDRADYDLVADRAGHDLRYAIDATRLRTELGWAPRYTSFPEGIARTVDWYRDNEAWWRPAKARTEARYAAGGQ